MRTKLSTKASMAIAMLVATLSVALSSCTDPEIRSGVATGIYQGTTAVAADAGRYIGTASSESGCYSLAESAGCSTRYLWFTDGTGSCYCK